jgi:hypothetical protein
MASAEGDAAIAPPDQAFHALTAAERRTLGGWASAVQACGIDTVQDLRCRPWRCPTADSIIGVFQAGQKLAAWLVVGQQGYWAVARCADGAISAPVDSLAEALALVCLEGEPFSPC